MMTEKELEGYFEGLAVFACDKFTDIINNDKTLGPGLLNQIKESVILTHKEKSKGCIPEFFVNVMIIENGLCVTLTTERIMPKHFEDVALMESIFLAAAHSKTPLKNAA